MTENYLNFFYGGVAGIVSRTVTAPFERLKMLRQNYPKIYCHNSILRSFQFIHQKEGLLSLFNGNLVNSIRIFPQNAIQYGIFQYTKNKGLKYTTNNNMVYFLSGATAGIISYTSIYPLETVRSKLSVQNKGHQYKGITDCLSKSIRNEGFLSLYRGSLVSAIGMIPFQGLNFLTYHYLDEHYNIEKNSLKVLLFGSWAGVLSVTFTYPFDTVKRRLQLSGEMGNPKYRGVIHCCKYILENHGIKGMYRGLLPTYTKIFPANGLYFFIIELLKNQKFEM
jgi:hypothetical protein